MKDLAKLLRISRRTVYRWVATKRLPPPIRCTRNCLRWHAVTIREHLDMLLEAPLSGERP